MDEKWIIENLDRVILTIKIKQKSHKPQRKKKIRGREREREREREEIKKTTPKNKKLLIDKNRLFLRVPNTFGFTVDNPNFKKFYTVLYHKRYFGCVNHDTSLPADQYTLICQKISIKKIKRWKINSLPSFGNG